ncbi:MAG TPA: aminotransferase class I/II-fold pyridoxal phosphate-dependent enzyme [Candidatus Nanopelagicales bacterium]
MAAAAFEVLSPDELRARTSLKWRLYGPDVLPLWVAEMDVLPAPEVVAALVKAAHTGDTGYPTPAPVYAEAFAAFAEQRWAWSPDPADTLVCADVMTGIRVLVAAVTQPGGAVVIPSPVYPPFAMSTRELGREVLAVPLTEAGRWDPEAIRAGLAQARAQAGPGSRPLLLLCNPHNPTGVVHRPDELASVGAIAAAADALVVVDEVHGPLTPPGATFVPWLSVVPSGVVVTSAAKAFNLAGLKAALLVAAPGQRALLRELPESVRYGASHVGVLGHAAGYGADRAWLDAVNASIAGNRALLGRLLAEHLPEVGYREPAATYLAWLDVRRLGLGDDPAAVLLREARVGLMDGVAFGPGGAGFVRLNVACSAAVLTEAVERIAAAVRLRRDA